MRILDHELTQSSDSLIHRLVGIVLGVRAGIVFIFFIKLIESFTQSFASFNPKNFGRYYGFFFLGLDVLCLNEEFRIGKDGYFSRLRFYSHLGFSFFLLLRILSLFPLLLQVLLGRCFSIFNVKSLQTIGNS